MKSFAILLTILSLPTFAKHKKPHKDGDGDDTVSVDVNNPNNSPDNISAKFSSTYQIYQLAQSWTPGFCALSKNSKKEQCGTYQGTWSETHLALHGLWPGYDDDSSHWDSRKPYYYPQFCSGRDVPNVQPSDLPDALAKYGPGYASDDYSLANNEWPKHGTCSGFTNPTDYFNAGIQTLTAVPVDGEEGTPQILLDAVNSGSDNPTISLKKLAAVYPQSTLFGCDRVGNSGQCRLNQIITCYDASDAPNVGSIIDCPDWATKEDYDNGCFTKKCKDQLLLY